ncbi:MAG: hypothetical protein E7004_03270 [Alphaproteobacteria bacterium]|nr:hypothetical protein [Alphaproteobacteria bacterium]
MTKYLKIALFAMIGIMFSGIAEAAITPINEAENDLKFGSRKKGELKCDNITTFSSPKSGMDCKVVTLSDNKTQCWKCDCSQKDYPYTKENCSGKLILDTSSSSCTDITTGKKYYKTCECGEGLLAAEEAKKYATYFDIGSPVQSAGNLACYDPKKFTCKNASNKITVSDITSYQHTSAKTRVKSKDEPVWYEVATNIETSNKDHNDLVMCVKKVDEFTSNVMSFQPEAKTCVETSTGTTKFLNISYHYYSGCNTTRSGCQESSHPCVEEEIVEVNGYSTSTKEAKTFSCSHISGCKIGKQEDSLCDKAPATDIPDLVYNKDNGCAQISCSDIYEYVGSGTGETSFNDANGDSANTNYTYVSKAPDASSDGWIICRVKNPSPIDEPTKEGEGICPSDATLTADGVCKCNNPDKKLVTDDNGEMYCECEEGWRDDPFDDEDKCVVDPTSEVMQCPEPSILNEDTGECICEDNGVCSLNCVDGKYELCGYFPITATGTTCTDLIWDSQKQMYLCKNGSTTFTSTRWDCIKTERKCKQACSTYVPDGHICTQTTVDGKICYTDCVPSICGTGYVNKGEYIVYGSTGANTHKMIAVKQGGKYYNPYIHSSGNFSHDNYKSGISDEYTGLSSSVTSGLSALADYQNITFWADGGCAESSGMMWIGKNGKLECVNKSTTKASHLIYLTTCTCPAGATGSLEEKTVYDAFNCKAGQYYSGSGYDCSTQANTYLVASVTNGNAIVAMKAQDLNSPAFEVTGDVFEQARNNAFGKCESEGVLSDSEYSTIANKLRIIWPDIYNNTCVFVESGNLVRTYDNKLCSGTDAAALVANGCGDCVDGNKIKARVICKKDFLSKSTTTKYSKCTCPSDQIYDGATGECIDYCPNKGTTTYCDSTKYNCEYEKCSGKYIVSCGSYFNKSGTPSCPSDRIVDKCSVNNYKYACATCEESDMYKGSTKMKTRLTLGGRISGSTKSGPTQSYSATVNVYNLCGEKVASTNASLWNITSGMNTQTSESSEAIPAGEYDVEVYTNLNYGPYSILSFDKLAINGTDYRNTGLSGKVRVKLATTQQVTVEIRPIFY